MTTVLIRGTGLLGTSLGLALVQTGAEVHLADLDEEAVQVAARMGAGSPEACAAPDLVVVAVPPDVLADVVLDSLQRYPAATVTDVGSVKAEPLAQIISAGGDLRRFVPGHPMAGREVSGAAAGRGDLFEDRMWILTPTAETEPARLQQVAAMAENLRAVVRLMDPHEHDRAVALCSHAPQVVASLLAAQLSNASASDVSVAGQGVRDTTRIAAGDPDLWSQILLANADHVTVHLDRFARDVETFRVALGERDPKVIRGLLEQGVTGRQRLPGKHGGAAGVDATVSVVIEDAPGQLAALFHRAGEAGVNLEDVRIEHTLGRLRAIVHLLVSADAEARLRESLVEGGWTLRG